jgi:predicted MPP superfamily phosphohydrolase
VRASTLPLAAAVAGAAGLGWSLAEARAFTLRRFTLPVLPPGSEPLRVLHVSDLHAVPSQRAKLEWLRRLGDLEPDLVVSTGDTLAHLDAVPAVLDAHGPLLERPGCSCWGRTTTTRRGRRTRSATSCRAAGRGGSTAGGCRRTCS